MQDWTTVGIDCIAMNVNDLYVMNLEPVAFVDYIATDRLSVEKMAQIGIGLNEGARQANIDIVGGETAEMPGFYKKGEYDLAGFAVGIVENSQLIDGSSVTVGDKIIGIASSGLHSNGYSLVRKLLILLC
jgi:phosphoribosylformylglycinamidine cyclo-ligase